VLNERIDSIPAEIRTAAEHHARKVEVCLLTGERDKAVAAIDYALREIATLKQPLTHESLVARIVCIKTAAILADRGVVTIGDLVKCRRDDLVDIRRIGGVSIDRIIAALAVYGFKLRG
jgi:DNA-directed RNA polymerase alpha subunit